MSSDNDHLQQRSFRLYQIGVVAWALSAIWLGQTSHAESPFLTTMGLLIYSLAVWPSLLWAKHSRQWFPVFEIYMLTGIPFYALPLFGREEIILRFPDSILTKSALVVVTFQICASLAFYRIKKRTEPTSTRWRESLLKADPVSYSIYGILAYTGYLIISTQSSVIPHGIDSIARAIFSGAGTVSVFTLSREWGLGTLTPRNKVLLIINLGIQFLALASGLYLITILSMLALALLGYATASRKIPLLIMAIALPIIGILHNGKAAMRKIYWDQQAPQVAITDWPQFYEQWVNYGLEDKSDETETGALTEGIVRRASLFQMIALCVAYVPDKYDYLSGKSYLDIPALLIPRILWPNKPSSLESNVRLALYFGLVTEDSAWSVSIAFGMIAEAYSNFGFFGVAVLGVIMGSMMKRVSLMSLGAPQFSAIGLFMILLTAWSIQVEMVAATWITSLFQAAIVVIGIPYFIKKL